MFEFNNEEFTPEQIRAAAAQSNMTVDDYIKQHEIKELGKTQPTTQKGAEPVDVMQVPELTVTESPSVDTSLELAEISNEEKRKLPYSVSQSLIRANKEFTQENINQATSEFEESKNRVFSERIIDESGIKKFKNLSYNIFGDEALPPGPMVLSRMQAINTAFVTGLKTLYTTPTIPGMGVSGFLPDLVRATNNYTELLDKEKKEYKDLINIRSLIKEQPRVTDSDADSLLDVIAGITGSAADVGVSVVPALIATTAGTIVGGPVAGAIAGATVSNTDLLSQFVTDYNIEKAKAENPNLSEEEAIQELTKKGGTEFYTPAAIAAPAMALEYVGLRGITKYIASKGSITKNLGGLLWASNGEGFTESFQQVPEYYNTAIAKGMSSKEAREESVEFFQENFFNTYINAAVGTFAFSGALKGVGYAGRKAWKSAKNMRVAVDEGKMENKISEIAELQQKKYEAKTIDLKTAIDEQIKTKVEELDGLVVKAAGVFNFANDKDFNEINDLEDLKKKYISKVKEINNKKEDIPFEEYKETLEIYKGKYLEAQSRIKGVVGNVSDKSNKEAQKVNKLYEEKGKQGIAEILELYRPMAKRIASKYRNVPGFDMDLMTDEILTGERGILDLINSYKPETNVPLSAYVNKFASTRGIEAAKRNLKEGFDLDVTEAKGVTDTTTEEITEQVDAPTEVQKLLSNELKLSDETSSRVLQAVEKTLGTKLPAVDSKDFKKKLRTGLRNELVNVFKQEAGKGAKYNEFISDVYDKLLPLIPQETLNRKLPFAVEPVLDPETGKQKREKTKEGKKIFKRKGIPKAEFIKYFTDTSLKGNVKGARKTSLAEILADEIGMDKVLPVLSKPEVLEKFTAVQELQGQQVPKDIPKAIASVIDRLDQFIAAAKEFENDRSILRSDFGFGNVVVKGLRVFAEATKAALNTGVSVANAIKQGVQAFKQYLFNSGLTEADIEDISSAIDNINESDLKLDPESLGNKIIDSAEKNSKTAIKNWLTESLKNISDPFELAEFLELNLTAFRNTYKKGDGFNLNTNDQVLDYIKDLIPKELYKLIDLKNRRPISVRQAQSAKFMQAFFKDESGFIEKQHEQAEYMRELVTKQVNKFKIAYKESKDESVLKNAHRWFQMQNSYMDTPFRLSQKIRLIVRGDFSKYVLEHNFPGKDQVRLYMNYIAGDIDYNSLSKALDNATLDLMPKELEYIYNIDEGMFHTMGKDFDYIKNDPKGKRYSETYLSELKKINGTITDLNSVSKKQKKDLDTQFNQLIQATTGVEYYKTYSPAKARLVGRGKGKRKFFIPYSADDFVGLLYATLGEGKVGDKQMAWYEENLLRPFSRGIQRYEVAKQKAMREWMALSSQIKKDVPGGLNKRNDTGFRNQDSLRMYIWAKQGMDVPGAAKSDVSDAVALVSNNPKLKEFAERLIALNPDGYPAPGQSWDAGDITTDIVSYVNDVRRGEFLTEWKQNVDQIFTDKNKQKLLASYGQNYIDALEDILHRMKTGRNRKFGVTKAERAFMDWTNNSVGAIMFFNARSAVLQTLSAVNFINFSDNNPINAGLAFANQPQYWKDFSALFNSDFLKQRRSGLQTDVNADEIANAAKSSSNKAKAALSAILKLGFTPTQIADSFAIASGGATFYRNRVKKYIKDGLDKEAAEKKAFTDFQEVAEETQQSARPDRISSQQASSLGRLVLAFGNTPMQYARLTKKATLDLVNGRGDWKTNISKIAYYSVIQNIIFSSLQQGLFALLFDEEDDEKEKSRYFRIGNSSFDTLLRGAGVYGAAAATVKNMVLEIIEQSEKSRPDYTKVAMEATALSPPINSKLRKLESAGKTFTYKQSKEKVFTEGFSFENPGFLAAGKTISALTNLPADRVVQKADHIHTAMQDETELWQSIALSLGWSEWDLNMIEKKTKGSATPTRRSRTRTRNRTRSRKRN